MSAVLQPATPAELAEAVKSAPRVIAVGAGTKPRLARLADNAVRISTAKLRGIVEYEPSEFTFTALAGTPVREVAAVLAERGQYLPFDPLFAAAGATLGGTVASGVSGPGRFRFGGLRDFILGVRFVDGGGRLMRLGGKVVKNAAGFDLLGGRDYNSLDRTETALSLNALVFLNPRSRAQVYLLGGVNWSGAHVNDGNGFSADYHYFGGQAGVGLELRRDHRQARAAAASTGDRRGEGRDMRQCGGQSLRTHAGAHRPLLLARRPCRGRDERRRARRERF